MAKAEDLHRKRSSIPIDGRESGSRSSLKASTESGQWRTDQIGRSSQVLENVEGQTRPGESGTGSAGMSGN